MNDNLLYANVVLVHGSFVDGSGWQGVYEALRADGYNVAVVQISTFSLDCNVAATCRVIDVLPGPVTLVGHSYGGAVITQAGNHHKVRSLAYIAAFAPDRGESVSTLIGDPPPGAPMPPVLPPTQGRLLLDRGQLAGTLAVDLPRAQAEFMADSQVPWGLDALHGQVTEPAWRTKPAWYLIAGDDRMIPPSAQRAMASRIGARTVEVPGSSHFVYLSQPAAVADLIKQATLG